MAERMLCSSLLLGGLQFWFIPLLIASTSMSWWKVVSASLPHCRVIPFLFVKSFRFHDERQVVSWILGDCPGFGCFYIFPGDPRVQPTLRIGGLIPPCEINISKDIGAFVTWVNNNESLWGVADIYWALMCVLRACYLVCIVAIV